MKIALLSLYSGTVFRGVESWADKIAYYIKKNSEEVLLIQGGKLKGDDEIYIRSVNICAKDYSGNNSLIDKIKRKLDIHPSDLDVKTFYIKSITNLVEFNPDIIIPLHGKVNYLKKKISRYKLKAKFIGVGHAGIPKDVQYYDGFITLTQRDMIQIENLNIPKMYIPNGVDLNLFRNINKDKIVDFYRKIENEYNKISKPILLVVSALVGYKRVNLAMEAIKHMKTGTLIVVGDGPEKDKLQNIANNIMKFNSDINIIFMNRIKYDDMPLLYRIADVFTHPADETEAFGSVIIEAMASGLPVVVNDDVVRRDIVLDDNYLVDPTDVDDYVNKIKNVLHNKDHFNKLSIDISEKYDWNEICKKYLSFFYEILRN